MRINSVAILLLISCLHIYASGYSQQITLSEKNASLDKVLDKIEKQSGYFFWLQNDLLTKTNRVTLNLKKVSLEAALDVLFGDQGLSYTIINKTIVIKKKADINTQKPDSPHEGISPLENSRERQQIRKPVAPPVKTDKQSNLSTAKGKVSDEKGEGLPGVSIVEKGTQRGTVSDANGNFTIETSNAEVVLVFSFVGYLSQEIRVNSREVVAVVLTPNIRELEQVVVVGYGTQQKKDITGAISSIKAESIKDQPITNIGEGMAGRMPGVLVQQSNGAPGTVPNFKIRGLGSISAGTGPLVVVDGQPLNDGALNLINPNDIESVDVLKDASATAIYGSRGSNGVLLVTTKKGTAGKTRINLDYFTGIQQVTKKMDILNSQQFAELVKEAVNNAYLDRVPGAMASDPNSKRPAGERFRYPRGEFEGLNFDEPGNLPYTDYQNLIFRSAPISSYQLSASGGSEKVRFMLSGNYLDQKGIIKKSGQRRYSLRSNIDAQLTSRLKVGLNFSPSMTVEDRVNADGPWSTNGVINAALGIAPVVPVYAPDGSYTAQIAIAAPYDWPGITNPLANITEVENRVNTLRVLGNLYAMLELTKGLNYRVSIGGDALISRQSYFQKSTMPTSSLLPPIPTSGYSNTGQNLNWVASQTLTFNRKFNDIHNFETLIGMESQSNDFEQNRVGAVNFPNDVVQTINYGNVNSGYSYREQWKLASYFARIAYNYKEKYLFNVSVRRDGSSRFGVDNRWGTFPSASAGWRMSEEDFLKSVPAISELKLRASYGLAGNNAFSGSGSLPANYISPNYMSLGLLGVDNYIFSNKIINGLAAKTIGNPN
uniref:SusC/RagA family TonB-linked outer membrane protein n=1 Tax=Dyadobacter sp. TaxID=1914288 RepID=UPI003F6F1459